MSPQRVGGRELCDFHVPDRASSSKLTQAQIERLSERRKLRIFSFRTAEQLNFRKKPASPAGFLEGRIVSGHCAVGTETLFLESKSSVA